MPDPVADSNALHRAIRAISTRARLLLPAATLAYAMLLAALVVDGVRRGFDYRATLLAGGVRCLWLLLLYAGSAVLLAWVPTRPATAAAPRRRTLMTWIATAVLWGALLSATRAWLPLLVPERFAFREQIQATALTFACLLLAWLAVATHARVYLQTALPSTLAAVFLLVARAASIDDLERYAAAYILLIELGTIAAVFVAGFGVRVRTRPHRTLVALSGLSAMASLCALFVVAPRDAGARTRLANTFPGSASALIAAASLFDLDGDGFPSLLVPMDCDDFDPLRHPLALEVVGNGVDDNCIGGDLARIEAYAPPRVVNTAAPRRNVVLITVDSVRADAFEAAPGAASAMPRLQAFAGDGAVFSQAYTQAPFTGDALLALHSGQYPMNFSLGEQDLGHEPFIAQLLQARGYRTVVQQQVWQAGTGAGRWRFYAGFDEVDDRLAAKNENQRAITSPETTDHAIAHVDALAASGQPFFFWVHYLDPHGEYMVHEGTPYSGGDGERDRYLQELWFTDQHLGRLLDHIDRSGLLESTLVIVCGDHGEYLGELDRFGHAWWLSQTTLHTILVLRGPGVAAGVYPQRVRLIDVYPTALELAASIHTSGPGRSLQPIWDGKEREAREVVARSRYKNTLLRSIMIDSLMLVEDLPRATVQLFDLRSDPAQVDDLSSNRPEDVQRLRARLGHVVDLSINDAVLARRREHVARTRSASAEPAERAQTR